MNRFSYSDIISDLANGAKNWRIWSALALNMIKMEYRRTVLGPFWMSIQQAIFILALGYMFAAIQKEQFKSFFVYFAIGYTFWILIATFVTSGGHTFMGLNGLPHMTRAALSNHIYLHFSLQMLQFAHRLIPLIIVLIMFSDTISINIPLLLFGLFMVLLFGFWISALLGCLSLRFQDLMPALNSVMQVMFFVTPVMFRHSMIPAGDKISKFNPFYHILVVVRGNIIDEPVTLFNWIAVFIINAVGICISLWVLRRSRPKLAYWA